MVKKFQQPLLESLEARQLMSISWILTGSQGFIAFNGGGFPNAGTAELAADPVIRADAQIVRNDMDKLAADTLALKTQLELDIKAIALARSGVDLLPLKNQLKADRLAWQATLKNDRIAIATSRKNKDFVQLAIDRQQLKDDVAAFNANIKADNLAIKNAVDNDPGMQAARLTYKEHQQIIIDDTNQLRTDWAILLGDINIFRSQNPIGGGFTISGSIGPDFIFGITTSQGYVSNLNSLGIG